MLTLTMGLLGTPAHADDSAPSPTTNDGEPVHTVHAPELGEPGVTWTTPDGVTHTLTAITEEQARALESARQPTLDDDATVTATADIVTLSDPPTPAMAPLDEGDAGITACWAHNWNRGFDNGALAVYGSQSWCGDGNWITHTSGNCWGESWFPTYHYYDCSQSTDFGVGWNVADLHVSWRTCTVYLGWEGGCMWNVTVWDHYRYGASGQVWWMGGSGW